MSESKERTLGVLLFPGFELLDVCGPLEMFGNLKGMVQIRTVAQKSGPVESTQKVSLVATDDLESCPDLDLILVPGGIGTRQEVHNRTLLQWLREREKEAEIVMSVCTGAALLAAAGFLDGRRATSNKRSFQFVVGTGPKVEWIKQARWVEDGKFVTSSGVSAGMDMTLAVIAKLYGTDVAEQLANGAEYEWHRDPTWDPFARICGLVG